ncbi:MAG: amidohydrolase family protein [Thermoanaerobaculia bacterium]
MNLPAAKRARPSLAALGLALLLSGHPATAAGSEPYPGAAKEVAEAKALFQANLDAIRHRDREAYLACYLESDLLARNGAGGLALGYADLAQSAGSGWPDVFDAQNLELVPLRPGVVYGSYRYRVRFGAVEQAGTSERVFVKTAKGWKIAVSTAFQAPPGTPPPDRALVGATLVDGTGKPPIQDAVVLVAEGKVACAGSRADCPVPPSVGVLDLKGKWITPGLIDTHVHFSQTGWVDGRPDAVDVRESHPYEQVAAGLAQHPEPFEQAYLCSGVTSVLDTGGYPWTLALARQSEDNSRSPRIRASGPLLSTLDFWLNQPAERQFLFLSDAAAGKAGVRYLAAIGSSAVKVWFIRQPGDDLPRLSAAVAAAGEEARGQGLPLIVHATGLAEAKEAVKAGAHLLVHSVWDQPIDDEMISLMRERGTFLSPTLTVPMGYYRVRQAALAKKAPEIDDPHHCVDAATRAKVAETATLDLPGATEASLAAMKQRIDAQAGIAAANLKKLVEAGIPVALGTDAGNPLTLHGPAVYAELEAMQQAGLAPMQVLLAATRDAARALGREKELGTLEKGKLADLLVLEADPTTSASAFRKLHSVMRGGVLRDVEELEAK